MTNQKPLSQALQALKSAAENTGSEIREGLEQGMEQIGMTPAEKRDAQNAILPHKIAEETETAGQLALVRKRLERERFQTAQSLGVTQHTQPQEQEALPGQQGIRALSGELPNQKIQPKIVQQAVGAGNRRDSKRSGA